LERVEGDTDVLFVGDDWAEDHHDVEIQDHDGRRLAVARLDEGMAGVARLHALIAAHAGDELEPDQVLVGVETDRGLWVAALVAAGYRVFAVNPRQAARFRGRHSVSGAKSDPADAHVLADMVRTDAHQLRPVAGDSDLAEAIKVLARGHQTLIWDRTRQVQRLRALLREFYPAALEAFDDLTGPDALELLGKAPEPAAARRLTRTQIGAALRRARRHHRATRTEAIRDALHVEQLAAPAAVSAASGVLVASMVALIGALNTQIDVLAAEVERYFDRHPAAVVYRSQPGVASKLGPRLLGEFGDDSHRYASAKARKNYAGTSPITRQSGRKRTVSARFVHNDRLIDALSRQAQAAISASPGARVYYDQLRARGVGHQAALRQLANRLVGILHGCLASGCCYDEDTAWPRPAGRAAA
jgi:transposase